MKRTIALTVGLALASALPALAGNATHTVYNTTDKCVWVTVDTSNMISPWRNDAAGFIKPGESHAFTVEARPELKIRAQPRSSAECSGGQIADVDNVTKSAIVDVKTMSFTIRHQNGKFSVNYGKP